MQLSEYFPCFYHEPSYTHANRHSGIVYGARGYKELLPLGYQKIITYNVVVGVGFILAGFASFL